MNLKILAELTAVSGAFLPIMVQRPWTGLALGFGPGLALGLGPGLAFGFGPGLAFGLGPGFALGFGPGLALVFRAALGAGDVLGWSSLTGFRPTKSITTLKASLANESCFRRSFTFWSRSAARSVLREAVGFFERGVGKMALLCLRIFTRLFQQSC